VAALDLTKFVGTLPYASELFGVYQPLLGWKSRLTKMHLAQETELLIGAALHAAIMTAPKKKDIWQNPHALMPADVRPPATGILLSTQVGKRLRSAALRFAGANGHPPNASDWTNIFQAAQLDDVIEKIAEKESQARVVTGGTATPPPRGEPSPSTGLPDSRVEAATAGVMQLMSASAPVALWQALTQTKSLTWAEQLQAATNAGAMLASALGEAVLSPVGLVHLYREYFFEFDTFLGPPVGHVWVSPGGSLELFEIHTRRSLVEKQVEKATEVTTRSQTEASEEDELSTAISEQNSRNLSMGITANVGATGGLGDIAVVSGGASASFGIQTNNTRAAETAHRHARKQSEMLSNEIRRSFKTTFRTSVETVDTSSRRYVLQNTTDKLVNYELRRKMRQVGVQVQQIGLQLCWQAFVNVPGDYLGIANLVHAAAPDDVIADDPPQKPTKEGPKYNQMSVVFDFEGLKPKDYDDHETEVYAGGTLWGQHALHDTEEDHDEGWIVGTKTITAQAPMDAADYTLADATVSAHQGLDPSEDDAEFSAHCELTENPGEFNLIVDRVVWNWQSKIQVQIDLAWKAPEPDPETLQAWEDKKAQSDLATQQAFHNAQVKLARERITLASDIRPRPEVDLRAEERSVIYRVLIYRLMKVNPEEAHLTSELIRSIFDIDAMLYFVAPDWWKPRKREYQHIAAEVTAGDTVNWGNPPVWGGRPNYMITEESQPAPLGASLGWLIQLDGDSHRNAFLNSPWVQAVLPIRPGKEKDAIAWLKQAEVEGGENLSSQYLGPEGGTVEAALLNLAGAVGNLGTDINNTLATETVFQTGFDPLEGGFRAPEGSFDKFDQWIEVLPTDQVVALEYFPEV
jgi:hypothetical protein